VAKRSWKVLMVGLIIVGLLPSLSTATTSAQEADRPGGHCVLSSDGPDSYLYGCFASEQEALDAVQSGNDAAARSGSALANIVIGVAYEYTNYQRYTPSFTVQSNYANPCDYETYGYGTMPADWNDRVSSIRAYSGCIASLYDLAYFSGESAVCQYCTSLGSVDNRVSSIRFT